MATKIPLKDKQRLAKKLELAGVKGYENMTVKEMYQRLSEIKEQGLTIPDLRADNKRPPTLVHDTKISEVKMSHLFETVDVTIKNTETGEIMRAQKPALTAVLDMLRQKALKDRDVPAAKEYLDRTLGKAIQEIHWEGTIKSEEQVEPTKEEEEFAKAYLNIIEAEYEDE